MLRMILATFVSAASVLAMATGGSVSYTATYGGSLVIGSDTLGGVTYTTVKYNGLFNCGEPGTPSLPVEFISFSVPFNATRFSVSAVASNNWIENISSLVYPWQQITSPRTVTLPDNSIYYSGSFYPAQAAMVVDESFIAGENHIVTVAVMPVSFKHTGNGNLATNQLRKSGTVSLTLNYDLSDNPDIYPIARQDTVLRNEGYELARSVVVNPNDVRGNSLPQPSSPMLFCEYPFYPQEVEGTPSTYVIVASQDMLHPLRRIAAWRQQWGIPVKLVSINDVLSDPLSGSGDLVVVAGDPYLTFTDDAGKLRQYLRMHYYFYGTKYVLLAGSQVPSRDIDGDPSDAYFGELNVDWASQDDKGMELIVGRLLGSDKDEIDNYTEKMLRYEMNPGNGDHSYLQRALYTYQPDIADAMDVLTDYFSEETFMEESELDDYPNGNDLLDSINTNHYAFICSFNKANPAHTITHRNPARYLWAIDTAKVAPYPYVGDTETGNGLNHLLNKNYPAVYFDGVGCAMALNQTNFSNVDVNYAESFTMGKDYGGPVFMGYSHEYPGLDPMYYYSELLSLLDSRSMCEAYAVGKRGVPLDRAEEIVTRFNFLGEPIIEMWTDTPHAYSDITVTRGDSTISVSGMPLHSFLSYCSNDGSLNRVSTNSSTVTLSHVDANSCVMLTRHNYIPYIAPLVLQNTTLGNSQYVIASEVLAGRSVDTGRASGDVTVPSGVNYEIEATGEVRIEGGFTVEQGAQFTIKPSEYNK